MLDLISPLGALDYLCGVYLGNNILDSEEREDDNKNYSTHQSYICEAFALAFPSTVRKKDRYMVILQGYFDESGTHEDSDVIVLAGFLATIEAWKQFEADWNGALEEYGLSYFHMSEFAVGVGAYANWTEDIRRMRLGHLMDIIRSNVEISYGISLSKKVFEKAFHPKVQRFVYGAYAFAAMQCFLSVGIDLSETEAWVAYILEDGATGKGEVLTAYDYLAKFPERKELTRVLSLRFEDKRRFVPLQAADILAYELYKEHPNQVGRRDPKQRMPWHLLYQMPHRWAYMGEREIREFAMIINLLAQRD